MKRINIILYICALATAVALAKTPNLPPNYAWTVGSTYGERIPADIDTTYINYAQKFVPSDQSPAYALTGNYGAEGENLIFYQRRPAEHYFFVNSLRSWLPSLETFKFYNTRIPMTLLSYNFGGTRETGQDRLRGDFSGNINSKAQVGAMIDYLYSKGSYANQADKNLSWGINGSYIGERLAVQALYYHYNHINKENGGIVDDRYITDPAEVQGGSTKVNFKTIPTNLTNAHTRFRGGQLFTNAKYFLGHYVDEQINDTTVVQKFVPVSSAFWTLNYQDMKHRFTNTNSTAERGFWENTYLQNGSTDDKSSYWSLTNIVGISLLEGFHKYAQSGLDVYLKHTYHHITQMQDTLNPDLRPETLQPLPFSPGAIKPVSGDNHVWVGGKLSRSKGRIFNYEANAEIGILGEALGDVSVDGAVFTNVPLLGDTLNIQAGASFTNLAPPHLYEKYISNHFAWDNDFSKIRRIRVGGEIAFPKTLTTLNVAVENMQNYIFFNSLALPEQHSGNVSIFHAALNQDLHFGPVTWTNRFILQTSSNQSVVPLPVFALYSNLYVTFRIATLYVQAGVDCDYYTRYKSLAYQPATMAFYNQDEVKCGNYPFMNLYINMKLKRAHFYLMFSHINQGLTGNNYFAMPNYPLNPRRFQLGVSVDFLN